MRGRDLRGPLQPQQGTGVAHVDVACQQQRLHRFAQVEQAQQVAGGAARTPHGLRGLLVREAKLAQQPLQALRLFERIEVFALDVFDQRHGGRRLVGHVAHQHRHRVQPGQPGRPKAPLAGDDFIHRARTAHGLGLPLLRLPGSQAALAIVLGQAAHQNRLHDALRLDAFGQLVQRAFVHARARLVGAGHEVAQGKLVRLVALRRV